MSSGITKVHSVFLVIIIILAVVAAAGWSRNLTPDQEMSSSEQSTVSVAFLWGGSEGDSFKAVLQQFEKTHPNIKLDMRQIPNEEYRSVITSQIAAGNPPDVVMLPWPSLARELAQEGKITPLNDLWSDWNERGWYSQAWRDLGTFEGQPYMGWFKANAKGLMWYNPSLFSRVGASEPSDWNEFEEVLKTLKSEGTTPIVVGGKDGWALSEWFEVVLVRVSGPEVFNDLVTHEISWEDPEVVKTLEVISSWVEQGYFSEDPLALGFFEAFQKRTSGEAGIGGGGLGGWVNGMTKSNFENLRPGTDYTFFTMPKFEGSRPFVQVIGGDGMVIPTDAGNVEGAKVLVDYLASPEAQEIWVRRGGIIATNALALRSADPNESKEASLFASADVILFDLDDQTPGEMQREIWNQLQRLWVNPDLVAEVASALEEKARSVYGT